MTWYQDLFNNAVVHCEICFELLPRQNGIQRPYFQRPFWSASVSADAYAEAKTSALHNLFHSAVVQNVGLGALYECTEHRLKTISLGVRPRMVLKLFP